jgi:hypothetical protein
MLINTYVIVYAYCYGVILLIKGRNYSIEYWLQILMSMYMYVYVYVMLRYYGYRVSRRVQYYDVEVRW